MAGHVRYPQELISRVRMPAAACEAGVHIDTGTRSTGKDGSDEVAGSILFVEEASRLEAKLRRNKHWLELMHMATLGVWRTRELDKMNGDMVNVPCGRTGK